MWARVKESSTVNEEVLERLLPNYGALHDNFVTCKPGKFVTFFGNSVHGEIHQETSLIDPVGTFYLLEQRRKHFDLTVWPN